MSPVQPIYRDGDQVEYACNNFISLKQHRKCWHGKWTGGMPVCGDAFRDNDLELVNIYDLDGSSDDGGSNGKVVAHYNLTGELIPFTKFGNTFIAERYGKPLRAQGAINYRWELVLQKPAIIQMVRISFSVVNHLTDERLAANRFDITSVTVSEQRWCERVANHSISPWHYNSTRFDYWYFCRVRPVDAHHSTMAEWIQTELASPSRVMTIDTRSDIPIVYDLATFILASPYGNNDNLSEPICGLPEVPASLEARVVNDQSNYVFTCAPNFKRVDNFGGQFHLRQCGLDYRWHGQLPECHPIKTCRVFHESDASLVEVFKYDRVYFVNDSQWVAIADTRAFFRCKDEANIFVGKEMRVCQADGEWSDSPPNCLSTLQGGK